MIVFLRRLLYDETFFERIFRVGVALFGQMLHEGTIPIGALHGAAAWWIGIFVTASALMVPTGQKNSEAKL